VTPVVLTLLLSLFCRRHPAHNPAISPHLQVWLNGKQICDMIDDPTDPAEASWKEAAPIWFQWPSPGESGGFAGYVKYKNIRAREL
jgi:hypothetical protein